LARKAIKSVVHLEVSGLTSCHEFPFVFCTWQWL